MARIVPAWHSVQDGMRALALCIPSAVTASKKAIRFPLEEGHLACGLRSKKAIRIRCYAVQAVIRPCMKRASHRHCMYTEKGVAKRTG